MSLIKITLGGKEYPLKGSQIAVKRYKELTNKNMMASKTASDIFDGVDFDPEVINAMIYSFICAGAWPDKPKFTRNNVECDLTPDELADMMPIACEVEISVLSRAWVCFSMGITPEEADEKLKQAGKNEPAP